MNVPGRWWQGLTVNPVYIIIPLNLLCTINYRRIYYNIIIVEGQVLCPTEDALQQQRLIWIEWRWWSSRSQCIKMTSFNYIAFGRLRINWTLWRSRRGMNKGHLYSSKDLQYLCICIPIGFPRKMHPFVSMGVIPLVCFLPSFRCSSLASKGWGSPLSKSSSRKSIEKQMSYKQQGVLRLLYRRWRSCCSVKRTPPHRLRFYKCLIYARLAVLSVGWQWQSRLQQGTFYQHHPLSLDSEVVIRPQAFPNWLCVCSN